MNLQQILNDDILLRTAFSIYQSSDRTAELKSEQNRTIFAENFKKPSALPLSNLCLKAMAQNYKVYPIILNTQNIQLRTFYDFIDENLSIEKCIDIQDEYFWTRDKMLLNKKTKQDGVTWKNHVVTLHYIDLIENTPYERWITDEMEKITQTVSPYITELKISKLQTMRDTSFQKEFELSSKSSNSTQSIGDILEKNSDSRMTKSDESKYNYPFQDCHHIDLSILRNLLNLNSLIVEFVPPKLGSGYHDRFFHFSYVDMQNLARGISFLTSLRSFKLRRSRMDSVKFSIIIEALKLIFVEEVEFYFCQLDDDCAESLFEFLVITKSLKRLDLSGNYFKRRAIDCISKGIDASASSISYLGLSNNPFSDESLCNLTKVLKTYKHLRILRLSGIQNSAVGSVCISKLVRTNLNMEELQIIATKINGLSLVDALKSNLKIQQILCQGCGLTLEEEFKIELLLKRNRYIKANPYIGDTAKTEEEIIAFISRAKNPIYVKTLEENKQKANCCLLKASFHK